MLLRKIGIQYVLELSVFLYFFNFYFYFIALVQTYTLSRGENCSMNRAGKMLAIFPLSFHLSFPNNSTHEDCSIFWEYRRLFVSFLLFFFFT